MAREVTTRATAVDPITLEIIRHGLIAAADEMKINLMRTAYNTVIYEVLDFSVGLFDRDGSMISQTSGLPIFLGNLGEAARTLKADVGEENLRPGDIYLTNDSYAVGTHLNDVTVMSPVFFGGELLGFAASRAHWIDVGGRDPGGWFSDTTEIYQEGLRLRSVCLYRAGEPDPSTFRILELNVRYSESIMGDLRAQIAACRTGEERFVEIVDRWGPDTALAAVEEMHRQADVVSRKAIGEMKDGVYRAESFMDDDGVAVTEPRIVVTVSIEGETMTVDLTGSSPQVKGPINLGLPGTISACRVALKCLTSPFSPVVEGAFRPLQVVVPDDCMFNAKPPAPCAVWIISITLIDTIFKALAPALAEKIPAGQYGDVAAIFVFGVDPRTEKPYLIVEPEGGGWGAFADRDGESVLIAIADGDTRNIPAEIVESKYPLRLERYAVRPDSGGAGRFRGGLGHDRDFRILDHDARITATMERSKCPPWGLEGGRPGATNVIVVNPGKEDERAYQKTSALPLAPGDVVSVRTGGGGGFGSPLERDAEMVREDVLDGYVSLEAAEREYGIALTSELEVDAVTTDRLRGTLRQEDGLHAHEGVETPRTEDER
jgi:N-methylhydantoinase B